MLFINPEKILEGLDLKEDMIAVEFGCGTGIFSLLLAKKLKRGQVYGIDILEEKLDALKARKEIEGVSNLFEILGNVEAIGGSKLQDNFADLVLIPNVLFENDDKKTIIQEAKRITKEKGTILILDWIPNSPLGPKEGTISKEDVKKLAEEVGLEFEKEIPAGKYHYCLLFKKP
jgi:ubiquinone/menaquinone biosynthesis C-methylase UbiE